MTISTKQVTILSLNHKGEGIAKIDNQVINIPGALPGEEVIVEFKNKNNAKLIEVIKPSIERTAPICSHFTSCGGCTFQHLSEKEYYNYKNSLLITAAERIGINKALIKEPIIIGPSNRRKALFRVKASKKNVEIGFLEEKSHNLFDLKECLLLAPTILSLLPKLKIIIKEVVSDILIEEVLITLSDTGIDITLYSKNFPSLSTQELLTTFANKEDIGRLSFNIDSRVTPIVTRKPIQLILGKVHVDLPEINFIQATKKAQIYITERIIELFKTSKTVLDLFCGCGTYSFPLAEYTKVHSVEGSSKMINTIKKASINYNVKNITYEQRDLYNNPFLSQKLDKFDSIIINPPRNGAEPQIKQIAASKVKNLIMVSCSLQSFIRDVSILINNGYKVEELGLVDQFYLTPHLEILAVVTKE
jgi:23S rRNA (uracil1939-C5)-methyltransferase